MSVCTQMLIRRCLEAGSQDAVNCSLEIKAAQLYLVKLCQYATNGAPANEMSQRQNRKPHPWTPPTKVHCIPVSVGALHQDPVLQGELALKKLGKQ